MFASTPERISTYCGWPSSPRPQKIARMPKAMVDHHFSGPWSHMSDITNLYTERRLWRVELGALLGFFSLHFHLQPYQVYSLCHWICRYMGGILTLPNISKENQNRFQFLFHTIDKAGSVKETLMYNFQNTAKFEFSRSKLNPSFILIFIRKKNEFLTAKRWFSWLKNWEEQFLRR